MDNNEEKDLFIKSELKDNYIPEKIENLFNNSINLIENERGMNMDENNVESKKSLPKKSFMKKIVAFAACAVIVLGGGQIYASTQGYGNVFFMIKYLITGANITVTDKDEILSDRDIAISYEPINITPTVAMQVKKIQVKDNQATLILQLRENNVEEKITNFGYVVKDENGNQLFSNLLKYGDVNSDGKVDQKDVDYLNEYLTSNNIVISNAADVNKDETINLKDETILKRHLDGVEGYELLPYKENTEEKDMVEYSENLKLNGFKNDIKKLTLDVFDNNSSKIVSLQIDLENRVIEVEGEEKALEKISEIELKEFLRKIPKLYDENGKIYGGEGKIFFALSISDNVETVDLKINGEYKIAYRADEINSILESFCGEKIDAKDKINECFSRYNENGVEYFVYEYGEEGINLVECIDVSNISYCGGLYTATFTYCDLDGQSIFDVDINDYDIYQNTVIFKINEEQNNTSKFRVISLEQPIIIKSKEEKEEGGIEDETSVSDDKTSNDKPANDGSSNDKPANDESSNDKPANDESSNDKPANDETTNDKPSNDNSSNDSTLVKKYLEGKWRNTITGEVIIINDDMIFDYENNNLKKKGTFTVYEFSTGNHHILLNFEDGNILELELTQADKSYLISKNMDIQYEYVPNENESDALKGIDNYASTMSWEEYWAPGIKIKVPAIFNLNEIGGYSRGSNQGEISTVINGVAIGIDPDTKEIIKSNLNIDIYEPIYREDIDENYMKDRSSLTNKMGMTWYLKKNIEGENTVEEYVYYGGNWEYKIIFSWDKPLNYKVRNIINWMIGSTRETSY